MTAAPHPVLESTATPAELRGRIGLAGGVFALVGYIIGGSIFIMPGALAAKVGPTVDEVAVPLDAVPSESRSPAFTRG